MEDFCSCLAGFRVGTEVGKRNPDACVQVGQLAHTAGHDVPLEDRSGEDAGIRPELLACTCLLCLANNLYGIERLSLLIFLLVDFPVAEHL